MSNLGVAFGGGKATSVPIWSVLFLVGLALFGLFNVGKMAQNEDWYSSKY
jgi:hypothetical protein